jgi:hypothetical protein
VRLEAFARACRVVGRHQTLEAGVILPELAASQVGQISIEAAQRVV